MKTKAAILVQLHKPLEIDVLDIPGLTRGQVLVRVQATSICGSQIAEIDGVKGHDRWLPHLLGHEGVGRVQDIGEGVRTVKKDDQVILHWRPSDGLEADTPRYTRGGKTVHAGRVTTFQEKTIVSENRLTKVSGHLDLDIAPLYGCCITTGFGVMQNDAKLKKGESVVIFGTGGLGLAETIAAKLAGAGPIIVVDRVDHKLMLARELGATHLINSTQADVAAEVQKILKSEGADVTIDNTGYSKVIESAYEICGPKGRTILVGVPKPTDRPAIDTLPLHFGKILTGSHGGDTKPHEDIPRYLKMQREGLFDLSKLITHRFPLDDINQAIRSMRDGEAVRCVIRMEEDT